MHRMRRLSLPTSCKRAAAAKSPVRCALLFQRVQHIEAVALRVYRHGDKEAVRVRRQQCVCVHKFCCIYACRRAVHKLRHPIANPLRCVRCCHLRPWPCCVLKKNARKHLHDGVCGHANDLRKDEGDWQRRPTCRTGSTARRNCQLSPGNSAKSTWCHRAAESVSG